MKCSGVGVRQVQNLYQCVLYVCMFIEKLSSNMWERIAVCVCLMCDCVFIEENWACVCVCVLYVYECGFGVWVCIWVGGCGKFRIYRGAGNSDQSRRCEVCASAISSVLVFLQPFHLQKVLVWFCLKCLLRGAGFTCRQCLFFDTKIISQNEEND